MCLLQFPKNLNEKDFNHIGYVVKSRKDRQRQTVGQVTGLRNFKMRRCKMKKAVFLRAALVVAISFLMIASDGETQQTQKKILKWGSSAAGSAGYTTLFGVAKIINEKDPNIYIEAIPTGGSTASQRLMGKGELDGAYSGAWSLMDIYFNRGPFAKSPYPADAVKPYQTWYCYLVKEIIVTKADRTDIKSWHDLAGKKVFVPVPGTAVYEMAISAFRALGVLEKMKIVAVPQATAADALSMGTVDAVVGYTNGDALVPWMGEVDARVKIKVVNPTPEEVKTISTVPGYSTPTVDTKKVFSQDVGVATVYTIADYYGFHVGKNISAKNAYTIIKILTENAKEVAKVHAMLEDYAKNPLEMQIKAMSCIPSVPVHPGVANYLKEKGFWKKELSIGKE
jgi:TRAP transporter TAXI family solute receptor